MPKITQHPIFLHQKPNKSSSSMSIERITLTQFTAKPSNRPAYTELAYGKTQGITSNFKTQHQQDSMYGFFSHFSENSKTTRKLFQSPVKKTHYHFFEISYCHHITDANFYIRNSSFIHENTKQSLYYSHLSTKKIVSFLPFRFFLCYERP